MKIWTRLTNPINRYRWVNIKILKYVIKVVEQLCQYLLDNSMLTLLSSNFVLYLDDVANSGLQIYGGPGSLSHGFKIWPITFQGNGPSGPILFSCEKNLTLIKIFILQQV